MSRERAQAWTECRALSMSSWRLQALRLVATSGPRDLDIPTAELPASLQARLAQLLIVPPPKPVGDGTKRMARSPRETEGGC